MVRYFFFNCLPWGFARWLGWPGLLEAECSLGHRASACPLERRDGEGGVKGSEILCVSQTHAQPVSSAILLPSSLCLSVIHCMRLPSAWCQEREVKDKSVPLLTMNVSSVKES